MERHYKIDLLCLKLASSRTFWIFPIAVLKLAWRQKESFSYMFLLDLPISLSTVVQEKNDLLKNCCSPFYSWRMKAKSVLRLLESLRQRQQQKLSQLSPSMRPES